MFVKNHRVLTVVVGDSTRGNVKTAYLKYGLLVEAAADRGGA